jgi:hypothetical protein
LDAVMMPSESHVKHSHVTALCNLRANNQQWLNPHLHVCVSFT